MWAAQVLFASALASVSTSLVFLVALFHVILKQDNRRKCPSGIRSRGARSIFGVTSEWGSLCSSGCQPSGTFLPYRPCPSSSFRQVHPSQQTFLGLQRGWRGTPAMPLARMLKFLLKKRVSKSLSGQVLTGMPDCGQGTSQDNCWARQQHYSWTTQSITCNCLCTGVNEMPESQTGVEIKAWAGGCRGPPRESMRIWETCHGLVVH